jgi:hypothetical protein
MDSESWYSVTPEPIAKHIAQRCLDPSNPQGVPTAGPSQTSRLLVKEYLKSEDPYIKTKLTIADEKVKYPFDLKAENMVSGVDESNNDLCINRGVKLNRVLDLFSGCGGNAIPLAGIADHVIAVDLNPDKVPQSRYYYYYYCHHYYYYYNYYSYYYHHYYYCHIIIVIRIFIITIFILFRKNAKIYDVDKNIDFICADAYDILHGLIMKNYHEKNYNEKNSDLYTNYTEKIILNTEDDTQKKASESLQIIQNLVDLRRGNDNLGMCIFIYVYASMHQYIHVYIYKLCLIFVILCRIKKMTQIVQL